MGSNPIRLILINESAKALSIELPAVSVVKAWENILQKTPALDRNEPESLVINSCCNFHSHSYIRAEYCLETQSNTAIRH